MEPWHQVPRLKSKLVWWLGLLVMDFDLALGDQTEKAVSVGRTIFGDLGWDLGDITINLVPFIALGILLYIFRLGLLFGPFVDEGSGYGAPQPSYGVPEAQPSYGAPSSAYQLTAAPAPTNNVAYSAAQISYNPGIPLTSSYNSVPFTSISRDGYNNYQAIQDPGNPFLTVYSIKRRNGVDYIEG